MSLKPMILAGAVALSACGGGAPAPAPAPDASIARDLATLRAATQPYQDLTAAVAAGYAADVKACIVHENHGAMGFHHINRSFIEHDIKLERPQFLLYERMPGGEYRLNAVEYFIPFRLWPRDSTPPTFMGQTMKPEYTFNYWYLHVWAWKENPDGLFADWHPDVHCAEDTKQVYHPNP